MGEISEPGAALNWAAGGMLLFFRAMVAHFLEWMKMPAGGGFSGALVASGGKGPQFPKHSRLATMVILLAAVTLFFLPIGREAMRTVKGSWRGFFPTQGEQWGLEKIAAEAERKKDARDLAFVAVTDPDTNRVGQFADGAVAQDPSLAWIYAIRYRRPEHWPKDPGWVKQLKDYDPDNGFVYLVSAYIEAEPIVERLNNQHGAAPQLLAEALAGDDRWMKEMNQAFRASNYDSYFTRHEELVREGWAKTPTLSPGLIAISLWRHNLPDVLQVQTYADLRVSEALGAGSSGHMNEAETILGEITKFGRGMTGAGATEFEHWLGFGLITRGLQGLEKLYRANGYANQAREIKAQLNEIDATALEQRHTYVGWRNDIMRSFKGKAIAVQASAILSLVLAVAIVLGLLMLEAGAIFGWRNSGVARWVACRVTDYGPVLFLVSGAVFLWSFRPIAALYEQYRSTPQPNGEAMELFWELLVLGHTNPMSYFYEPYHQWLVATVALATIAVIVLVRGVLRRVPAAR
jgi:hypothetical protein